MLSGKKKKDYAAESAASALETQAGTLGAVARSADDDEDDDEPTHADDGRPALDASDEVEEGTLVAA